MGISEGLTEMYYLLMSTEKFGTLIVLSPPILHLSYILLMTRKENLLFGILLHTLCRALEDLYPGVKLGIGPNVDNGFYYDIDLGDRVLSTEDLPKIEKKMKELVLEKYLLIDKIYLKQMLFNTSKKKEMNIN